MPFTALVNRIAVARDSRQGQLVESEDCSGRDGEIILAARTAPDLAGRSAVVPMRHAAVRADYLLAFAPAKLTEQGQGLIVTHGQNLDYGQAPGFGFQQERKTHRTGSWGWVMRISVGLAGSQRAPDKRKDRPGAEPDRGSGGSIMPVNSPLVTLWT